jgi:hypothetical protein
MTSYLFDDFKLDFSNAANQISYIILSFFAFGFGMTVFIGQFINSLLLDFWKIFMEKLNRRRIIMDSDNNEPYMERYYLFLRERGNKFPFNIFIQKYLKSDENDLYDHPWGSFNLILKGGYWEHIYTDNNKIDTKRIWRSPGFYQRVEAEYTHKIELEPNIGYCWVLCIPFKQERQWGFWKHFTNQIKDENEKEDKDEAPQQDTVEWVDSEQYVKDKQKRKEE